MTAFPIHLTLFAVSTVVTLLLQAWFMRNRAPDSRAPCGSLAALALLTRLKVLAVGAVGVPFLLLAGSFVASVSLPGRPGNVASALLTTVVDGSDPSLGRIAVAALVVWAMLSVGVGFYLDACSARTFHRPADATRFLNCARVGALAGAVTTAAIWWELFAVWR